MRLLATSLLLCVPVCGGVLDVLQGGEGAALYGLVVLALLLGACGVPIPEEAVFATAGGLAAAGRLSLGAVFLLGWTVVLALDLVLHALGARFGPALEHSRLGRRVGPDRWEWVRRFVARRGVWAVAVARLVMGMRIPVFLLAGAMGMPRRRFLAAVAAVGLLSAGLPLLLGHALAEHLEDLLAALGAARWILLGAAVLGLVAWWWRARRRP